MGQRVLKKYDDKNFEDSDSRKSVESASMEVKKIAGSDQEDIQPNIHIEDDHKLILNNFKSVHGHCDKEE